MPVSYPLFVARKERKHEEAVTKHCRREVFVPEDAPKDRNVVKYADCHDQRWLIGVATLDDCTRG